MRLSLKIVTGITAILLLVNVAAFLFVGRRYEALIERSLLETARTLYHEVVLVRGWVAEHGRIYVPRRTGEEPNPFLAEPETVTVDGERLVVRNPAMVTRELAERGRAQGLPYRFAVTGLEPVNPANAPDPFERRALAAFAGDEPRDLTPLGEYVERTGVGTDAAFRYAAPLLTEASCLSCHGDQGYRVGDLRGAFSVAIPLAGLQREQRENRLFILAACLLASAATAATAFVYLRRTVIRPIHALESAAASIGTGNYETPIAGGGRDEIGDLGRALGRMQREIAASTERQLHSEKLFALGEIAAGIAHDLRNPLFALRSDLDYLRRSGERSADDQEVFDEMEDGIERIDRIVDAVREFARSRPPEFERRPLAPVIAGVEGLLRRRFAEAGARLTVELPAGLPEVEMDPHRIEQVLVNLLTNALHALPPAGGEVRVTASRDGDRVRIRVTDDGRGIRPEIRDRIFDPFFTRTPSGSGLGLTIVRRIVDQHHGGIAVESEEGRGTMFIIALPLTQTGGEP